MNDFDFCFGILVGLVAATVLFTLAPSIELAITHQNDPHCMGWGTTDGKEFPPPTTEWYNKYCLNNTRPTVIFTELEGHTLESCQCYESKANDWFGLRRVFL